MCSLVLSSFKRIVSRLICLLQFSYGSSYFKDFIILYYHLACIPVFFVRAVFSDAPWAQGNFLEKICI